MAFFTSNNFIIQALFLSLAFCPSLITAANPSNSSQQLRQSLRDNQLSSDSDLTTFPRYGDFPLVLQDPDSLEFQICSTGEISEARALFCFPTSNQLQVAKTLGGCGAGMCAYNLKPAGNGKLDLNEAPFKPTKCFKGKLDQTSVYALDFNNEDKPQPANGCPMKVDARNLFNLKILSIAEGVTMKALNAKKYVPPTTPAPQPDHVADESVAEGGISGTHLALIIVGGVLIVLLIIAVIAAVIYCCCCKRKNAKPRPVTVIKVNGPKPAAEVQPEMPSQVQLTSKPLKEVKNEVKPKVEASKPKVKTVKPPKNVEENPPQAAKTSPMKTAIENLNIDPTQESTKSDGAPPPVIDENDYDENSVVAPPPSTAPPPLSVPPPAPARRSHVTKKKKPQSKKKPIPESGKYYDNGRPYVQTPFKWFVRSGGSKKDSLDGTGF